MTTWSEEAWGESNVSDYRESLHWWCMMFEAMNGV
eukprot:CAMPEP_0204613090 /NCGR_PEP_ID=MMETSP0717-20131115/1109_1 /ASSEMBLY_ACC=CAM_ASM_000666 /TAXON_ID=230516 /ORGANISM="Chaetoceros curvisetus" /LENGTH=34 /DNA_ID= /DNA_START= /DNA_END= /DNA_ORIENTATION=